MDAQDTRPGGRRQKLPDRVEVIIKEWSPSLGELDNKVRFPPCQLSICQTCQASLAKYRPIGQAYQLLQQEVSTIECDSWAVHCRNTGVWHIVLQHNTPCRAVGLVLGSLPLASLCLPPGAPVGQTLQQKQPEAVCT